eukprot:gene17594-3114_t
MEYSHNLQPPVLHPVNLSQSPVKQYSKPKVTGVIGCTSGCTPAEYRWLLKQHAKKAAKKAALKKSKKAVPKKSKKAVPKKSNGKKKSAPRRAPLPRPAPRRFLATSAAAPRAPRRRRNNVPRSPRNPPPATPPPRRP